MRSPKLEVNANGFRYLIVYYCPCNSDFTKLIKDAFAFHKISAEEAKTISVVVLPITPKN